MSDKERWFIPVDKESENEYRKISHKGIEHETAYAFLLKHWDKPNKLFWLPKAICQGLKPSSVYIWNTFEIELIDPRK